MRITITNAERSAQSMARDKLAAAVQSIRELGCVILENAIDREPLDILRDKMTDDTHQILAAQNAGRDVVGWKKGHLQQRPPPNLPYVFRDIVANPLIVQVTRAVLGDGLFNAFYSGNTNVPGSDPQPIHRDARSLWTDNDLAHPASTLVVNISPIDVHADNGSTEIWPGTHLLCGEPNEQAISQRRTVAPPTRVTAPVGSAVIRDIRLWHRGVPNTSDQIRHMIAMVHQIQWFRRVHTLPFQTGCENQFADSPLDPNAEFINDLIDYLFGPFHTHS
ncbi:MAG: hypothetical protein CMJ49_00090 [Planctomycetaceae bacterium]|nr:hypothetical protein [Planctomycetaceae bacterium]